MDLTTPTPAAATRSLELALLANADPRAASALNYWNPNPNSNPSRVFVRTRVHAHASSSAGLEVTEPSHNGGVFAQPHTTATTTTTHPSPLMVPDPDPDLKAAARLVNLLRVGGLDTCCMSYREKFLVRCYEVGMNRAASIETVANLLQEVACNHAQSVGFSTDGFATTPTMRKMGLIWVTTRMHIEVNEYPAWGDVVEVETWCQSVGKIGTRRDWLIMNAASGKTIGRATSTWVMMNQNTRRLARVTDDIRSEYLIYCPDPPRWAFPDENDCSVKKIPKLEDPTQYLRSGLMPRRGDLDMNQHVNNVTYIGWILESTPQDIIDTHQLHTITLDYRRECKHGDLVESVASLESGSFESDSDSARINNGFAIQSEQNSLEFLHMLRLVGSCIEINRGRTKWRKKEGK